MAPFSVNGKWTRRFAWVNLLAVVLFIGSCLILVQFDWRGNPHNMFAPSTSLPQRLSREPRMLVYFLICIGSLSWLIGFFTLGMVSSTSAALTMSLSAMDKDVERLMAEHKLCKRMQTLALQAPVSTKPKRRVAILGGTGLVGRALAIRLLKHKTMELGYVIGSPDTAGKPLRQVWEKKEQVLRDRYGAQMWQALPFPLELDHAVVAAFDELFQIDQTNLCVISCIAPALGWMEEKLLGCNVPVYSISPYARDRVPLVVPEVNYMQLNSPTARLFKSPNCVSCGVCLVLDAMRKAFGGLEMVSITTFQSLSGRGDALYDPSLVVGNVLPLGNTEEDTNNKIRDEVCSVLGLPELKISVTAQRVYTQRGHYVDVRLGLKIKPQSVHDVKRALEQYRPLAGWNLPDAPIQPIVVSLEPKFPRPVQVVQLGEDGMSVHVGHITANTDRVFDVTLSLVVDNVARGAYGAALLTAQVHELMMAASGQ
ncbi:hypothetical protein BASA81_015368 [Batrachochytrium salamandrivorans]|nr:hypothetical protein BASA81_015368 [Batrachochytrium salamandrivorans]